jgi:hypothetical protein
MRLQIGTSTPVTAHPLQRPSPAGHRNPPPATSPMALTRSAASYADRGHGLRAATALSVVTRSGVTPVTACAERKKVAQHPLVNDAYGMTDRQSPADGALNEYFRAHNPFVRAQDESVAVHVSSVPRRPPRSTPCRPAQLPRLYANCLWSPNPRSARMVTRRPGGMTADKRRRQVSSMALR